jgi:hypothetical protein
MSCGQLAGKLAGYVFSLIYLGVAHRSRPLFARLLPGNRCIEVRNYSREEMFDFRQLQCLGPKRPEKPLPESNIKVVGVPFKFAHLPLQLELETIDGCM